MIKCFRIDINDGPFLDRVYYMHKLSADEYVASVRASERCSFRVQEPVLTEVPDEYAYMIRGFFND